jgi:hypothetical protein
MVEVVFILRSQIWLVRLVIAPTAVPIIRNPPFRSEGCSEHTIAESVLAKNGLSSSSRDESNAYVHLTCSWDYFASGVVQGIICKIVSSPVGF